MGHYEILHRGFILVKEATQAKNVANEREQLGLLQAQEIDAYIELDTS